MNYTISEMAKKLDVAPSTLRYYDKEGLLPFVERSSGGARIFKDSDFEWLQIIDCLKKTGMQLKDIKNFVEMAMRGDETIEPRLQLIIKQKEKVKNQIDELSKVLKILDFKEWYYNTAKENGTTEIPRDMSENKLPDEFKSVRKKLRGI